MNTYVCAGRFEGGEIEPGTFHGDEVEAGTLYCGIGPDQLLPLKDPKKDGRRQPSSDDDSPKVKVQGRESDSSSGAASGATQAA